MLGFKNTGSVGLNPNCWRPWKDGYPCVWEANGVVKVQNGKLELLRPTHFARHRGRRLDFYTDYYIPFAKRFCKAVHALQPEAFIFIEDAPFSPPGMPHLIWDGADAAKHKIVCADHWYDGIPLVRKKYNTWLAWDGEKAQVFSQFQLPPGALLCCCCCRSLPLSGQPLPGGPVVKSVGARRHRR